MIVWGLQIARDCQFGVMLQIYVIVLCFCSIRRRQFLLKYEVALCVFDCSASDQKPAVTDTYPNTFLTLAVVGMIHTTRRSVCHNVSGLKCVTRGHESKNLSHQQFYDYLIVVLFPARQSFSVLVVLCYYTYFLYFELPHNTFGAVFDQICRLLCCFFFTNLCKARECRFAVMFGKCDVKISYYYYFLYYYLSSFMLFNLISVPIVCMKTCKRRVNVKFIFLSK